VLVLLAVLALVAVVLVDRWQEVRPVLARLTLPTVALAMVAVLGGLFCSLLGWRAALAGLGSPLPLGGAMRVYFLGQLGKYVPGSLWSVVAQVELGRDYGVPRRSSGTAVGIATLTALATGLALAGAGLAVLGPEAYGRYAWSLLILPVAVAVLWPPLLNRLIAVVLRLARRAPMPVQLDLGAIVRVTGWSLAAWALYGIHVWVLALGVGAGGATLPLEATTAFAGAWCIGFLLVVAPAGAGAREAVLVFLLHPTVPSTEAAIVALTSRLVVTVAEVVWGLVALGAERRRRERRDRPGRSSATTEPASPDGSTNEAEPSG
jgi:glycosyltransferase 2 family protein